MITEIVFKILFLVPRAIISLFSQFMPDFDLGLASFTGFLELLSIGNQFFPVGLLIKFLSVWLALSVVSMTKSFIDWLLSVIPFY